MALQMCHVLGQCLTQQRLPTQLSMGGAALPAVQGRVAATGQPHLPSLVSSQQDGREGVTPLHICSS